MLTRSAYYEENFPFQFKLSLLTVLVIPYPNRAHIWQVHRISSHLVPLIRQHHAAK